MSLRIEKPPVSRRFELCDKAIGQTPGAVSNCSRVALKRNGGERVYSSTGLIGMVSPACYDPPSGFPIFPLAVVILHARWPLPKHDSGYLWWNPTAARVQQLGSPPVLGELASNEHSARRRTRYAGRLPARVWFYDGTSGYKRRLRLAPCRNYLGNRSVWRAQRYCNGRGWVVPHGI
jgi:hypothetical protein